MKRIEIKFTNSDYITIKLFDNQLNSELIDNFKFDEKLYKMDHIRNMGYLNFYGKSDTALGTDDIIESAWKLILDSIYKMKELGINFIREIPSEFDYSQDTLNYLHRVFTYSSMLHQPTYMSVTTKTPEFPFTSDFQLIKLSDDTTVNARKVFDIIEPINAGVHELEQYSIPTENFKFVQSSNSLNSLYFRKQIDNSHTPHNAKWYSLFERNHYNYNYEFMKHTESNIVCLTDTILGKSPLVSFINDDNPSLPDCTGRFITQGEFIIYPNKNLYELYQSNQFKSWLNKYDMTVDETPLEVAIGHVIESSIPIESFYEISSKNGLEVETLKWLT